MIIGYYHQIFFGGGTYYKLSKKEDEKKYKFEYCHQSVPNHIPGAEEYIKKFDTLEIKEKRFKEYFEGKIVEIYLEETNPEIEKIMEIVNDTNWDYISKQEYTDNTLDDVCWDFYIKNNIDTDYSISGYAIYPKEIRNIYQIFNKMKETYIGNVKLNKTDLENILKNKKSNLAFIKHMAKRGNLAYTKEDFKNKKEQYKNYEKSLKEIYNKEKKNNN